MRGSFRRVSPQPSTPPETVPPELILTGVLKSGPGSAEWLAEFASGSRQRQLEMTEEARVAHVGLTLEEYGTRLCEDAAGVPLHAEEIDRIERKNQRGETPTRDELIVLDAAQRMARPMNRAGHRHWRKYPRPVTRWLFARPVVRSCRSPGRQPRSRRVTRCGTRASPRRSADDPEPELVVPRGAGAVA